MFWSLSVSHSFTGPSLNSCCAVHRVIVRWGHLRQMNSNVASVANGKRACATHRGFAPSDIPPASACRYRCKTGRADCGCRFAPRRHGRRSGRSCRTGPRRRRVRGARGRQAAMRSRPPRRVAKGAWPSCETALAFPVPREWPASLCHDAVSKFHAHGTI